MKMGLPDSFVLLKRIEKLRPEDSKDKFIRYINSLDWGVQSVFRNNKSQNTEKYTKIQSQIK